MRKANFSFYLLFFALLSPALHAQKSLSNVYLIQQMDHFKNKNTDLKVDNFFAELQNDFQFSPASSMKLEKKETGYNGMEHFKYRQYHKGIPVFGATYILHAKNKMVQTANGYFRPQIDLNIHPSISNQEALANAMQDLNATSYIWETQNLGQLPLYKEKPIPHLVLIDPAFPQTSETLILAYQVDLHSWEPYDKQRYFINAHTGRVEKKIPLIHDHAVPGIGATKYYGEQEIIVDSIGPTEFYLHDPTRGNGITTFNFDNTIFQNNSSYWDLENESKDEVALDAHYCAEKFYDLLLNNFQWNGLGNNGESMNPVVHIGGGAEVINAFWDGELAWFGDGNCNNGPLTTLEVVGHEFTHGLIDYTSDLIYADESGAINESMADVFGKLLEHTEDPDNFNWSIGKSFPYWSDAEPFRSMEDPASLGDPDFYKGALWQDGANVHTNSSIGNHWFYLVSEGKTGTNEIGVDYDVPGIGIEKAGAIVFLANRVYLISNSNYTHYFESSILAAAELFGINSTEVIAVREAWKAVGLPGSSVAPDILDLAVSVTNEFRDIDTCQHNGYFPLKFVLSNVGAKNYIPKSNDQVEVYYYSTSGQVSIDIPITDTIASGESITISVDTFLFIDDYLNTNLTYKIANAVDENFRNNSTYSFFTNSFYSDNEIQLSFTLREFNCQTNLQDFTFSLFNKSCNPLPHSTTFNLHIVDTIGNTYWSETIVTEAPIRSQRQISFQRAISFEWQEDFLLAILELADDPDQNNNAVIVDFWEPYVADISYANDFSFPEDLNQMQFEGYINTPLHQKDNESWFIATGRYKDPNFKGCINPFENFNAPLRYNSPISDILHLCIDLSKYEDVMVSFDLVQYRNDELEEPFPESAMMRIAWDDGIESGQEIIFNQEEGKAVHHTIPLPSQFTGELEFKFSNMSGVNIADADVFLYDVNLLDKLSFSGNIVNTTTPIKQQIKLFPNPVSDHLYLEGTTNIQNILITNTQGQTLYVDPLFDGSPIDISILPNGYYWLSLWNEEFGKTVIPFVKI